MPGTTDMSSWVQHRPGWGHTGTDEAGTNEQRPCHTEAGELESKGNLLEGLEQ